jgi:hypothetical protein
VDREFESETAGECSDFGGIKEEWQQRLQKIRVCLARSVTDDVATSGAAKRGVRLRGSTISFVYLLRRRQIPMSYGS